MSLDPGCRKPSIGLTLVLAAIGATSIELAICGLTHSPMQGLLHAALWIGMMLAGFALLERKQKVPGRFLSPGETGLLCLLALLPMVWHPARVAVVGGGILFESLLLETLRNLGLALAAFARRAAAARLTVVIALFEVLVGASLVDGPLMTGLTSAFAVLGAGWLLAGYWSSLPGTRAMSRLPLAGGVAALGVVAAIGVVAVVGPTTAATVLMGLVPSSGGSDWSDPEARSGVGDGPNEVEARDSADSVGFTQSEVYLESDKPSLYDTFSETFGEPMKRDRHEKAIAVAASDDNNRREHPREDHRAGREFATHRKPPRPQDPRGEEADALLYHRGRAPAHLRLVAYHEYDGTNWLEGQSLRGYEEINKESEYGAWLRVEPPFQGILTGRVSQRVKLGNLETAVVPAPAHLARFRVGSVHRPDFFEWAQPGILRMAGRSIPPGTVIDLEVQSPRPAALRDLDIPNAAAYAATTLCDASASSPAVARLASTWSAGVPRGWGQVEAVVHHLRHHCVHDRSAVPPADCPDVLQHFLDVSRRGPDYLFASAAGLMLRSLGYPTRVVGGLYADPSCYDPLARHVPVTSAHAHLWAEVQIPGGVWVAIEPTPGFELMAPPLSLLEQVLAGLTAAGRWVVQHAGMLVLAAAGFALIIRKRREVFDMAYTVAWWFATARGTPARAVMGTLRLVERRASLAGRARGRGVTTTRWCAAVGASAPQALRGDLFDLVQLAGRIAYAPGSPLPDVDWCSLSRRVIRSWTLHTFRTLDPRSPKAHS